MWIEGKGEAQQPPRPDQQAAEAVLRSHGIAVLTQYDDVGLFLELHLDDPVAPRAMRRLAKQASAVLTQAFGGHSDLVVLSSVQVGSAPSDGL